MERDDLNHGDKQFASTFRLQGKESPHLPFNKDGTAECSSWINCDKNGGSFNLISDPCRLPPTSHFLHGDMVRMPQLVPGIDFPVDNCSKISYQQPSIGHGLKRVTDNSPNLHPLVPDSMDYFFQDPMYDSLITANNMQNVTTDLHDVQNPQFGGVFEPAACDANGNIQMARLDHEANNNNIYMSSFTENVGNFNNSASTLLQSSLGEEIGNGNSVLRSPIQSQGNLDGSFLTLGIGGNMDLQSMGNSWRGTMPSNSQGLIFSQVTASVQKATANPSEVGAGGYFGLTDHTNRDNLANDNFGGLGSLASGFSLGQFCAPERPQADGQHSIPPKNRNLEWNVQAGQINIGPSKLSQGSLFVSPITGYSSQAELPNSRQSRGTEIPILCSNSVLDNQNFFPLSGQLMGSGEPISLQNNAQPVSNRLQRFSAESIGKFLSQSSASTGPVTWRNQSGNPGQPLPAATVQSFRNYLGPACTSSQATSLQTVNASSQAFPVHIPSSLKRNAAESSTPTFLVQQKKIRTTPLSPYPSVPNVPLTTGALRSSAQAIPSLPSQLFTAQSTPPVPITASLASVSRPSSCIRTVPQGASYLPYMSPSASPDPPVSNVVPILPSGFHAASLLGPRTYKVRSSPVPVLSQGRLLAKSTPDVCVTGQGLNETLQPIGEKCYICKRDLSFSPEGPISQPAAPPDVAILPCRHTFHDICLQKITAQDQTASPPCIPCALGET